MEFDGIKEIAIYVTDCVADISIGIDETCRLVSAKEKYFDAQSDGGTLTVTQKSRNFISRLLLRRFEIKLSLPKSFKGRLRFRTNNGGVYIRGALLTDVDLAIKNGKIDISDIECDKLSLKLNNGEVSVKSIKADAEVTAKCSNGAVRVETVSAPELSLSCRNTYITAIDVKTDKLDCRTYNGSIDVSAVSAEDIRLETANGRINALALGTRDEYRLSLETSNGSVTVDGTPTKNITDPSGAKKRLNAKTSNGEISLRFVCA